MSEEVERSLTDEQVKADYRTNREFLPMVLREFAALEERLANADDADEIMVPVQSLTSLRMGMRAMIKSQTEFFGGGSLGISGDADTGDRGANCDYNPFNKVNFGDF